MFERRKLDKIHPILTQCLVNDFHFGGLTLSGGMTRVGRKYTGAYAKVKKMGKTLATALGKEGGLRLIYRLDKTLTFELTFSFTNADAEYELIKNFFYEYEECDFEDDVPAPFHDLELTNCDDATVISYTLNDVTPDGIAECAERMVGYVMNVFDVYLENLLEEYGEE